MTNDTAVLAPAPIDTRPNSITAATPEVCAAAGVPVELSGGAQWVAWKSVPNPGAKKPRKLPINPHTGAMASSTDSATWSDYTAALAAVERYRLHQSDALPGGVGFVFTDDDPYSGVDLDDCRKPETGEIAEWAQGIIAAIDSYTEVSPSRTGVKIFLRGKLPANAKHNTPYQTGSVEMYSQGRFFTLTGLHLAGTPASVEDRQAELKAVYADVFGAQPAQTNTADHGAKIVHPNRIPYLRKRFGQMHGKGMDPTAIEAALLAENLAKCDPPEDEAKIRKMVADMTRRYPAGTFSPASDGTPAEYADDALALRFTALHGEDLRYTALWGRWSRWDGTRWSPDETLRVFDLARAVCRAAASSAKPAIASRIASAPTVAAVERLARADRQHASTVDQWDSDLWLLNTPAGVVDLHTGKLRPAMREDYMTKLTAVAPAGECRLWQSFLSRITDCNEDLQRYLQRMCGYALTGVTREHAMFFLYGTGANGKSVFLNSFSGMLGDYAKTAPIEAFIASKNEHHPTDLAGLQGARLVTAVETEDGRRWAESKIKSLTGGDRIAARFMRQDFFEYTPQFKLVIAGNHKPGLRTVDEAMRRRFNLLPFVVTIPAAERDLELAEKLRAEWGGILRWAVEGCLLWQRDGLHAPKAVVDATADYLASEDVLSRWIEERCEINKANWTAATALFTDWREWCEQNQEYAGSQKSFSAALEDRGFAPERTRTARGFLGIGLRVTDVTGSPIIPVTRARTHIRPNRDDPSHVSQTAPPARKYPG